VAQIIQPRRLEFYGVFAANTEDPSMINVFAEGRDLYSEVA
jgi:hypothetical protein